MKIKLSGRCSTLKTIRELQQENKRLNERLFCYAYEKDCHLQCKQKDCAIKNYYKCEFALKKILQEIDSCEGADCGECKYGNINDCRKMIFNNLREIINEVLNVES